MSKATNRFTADTTYDEAGNVTVDDKIRDLGYSYDANGRMVKATKAATPDASSVYDASGMRVAEKVNDVWRFLIYDIGGKCIAEYGGAASTDEGGVKYPLKDWQGSTRGSISNTGNVRSRQDFTAFGEEIGAGTGLRTSGQGFGASDSLREKYGLTERDDATGLDHTWFRKHENQAGRWTSPDPYNGSMSLGSSQSFNRYSYVGNEPTNLVDPSGLNASSGFCVTWVYGTEYKFEDGTIIRIPEGTYTFCFGGGGYYGGGGGTTSQTGSGPASGVNAVLDQKGEGRDITCREFLNKVLDQLKAPNIDSLLTSIKPNIHFNSNLKSTDKGNTNGLSYFSWDGKEMIDVRPYSANTPQFDEDGHYARIIFHELLHHAKKGRSLFTHGQMAAAVASSLGLKKPKGTSDTQYISQQINVHCPNAPKRSAAGGN